MNILGKLNLVSKVTQAVFLKRKFPLVATWNITYRCNLQCVYCGAWEKRAVEMNTRCAFMFVDRLVKFGIQFIKLSGGEPLAREDLGKIIDFCKNRKLNILLNSNGTLVKEEFKKIKRIDEIQFSFDGPPNIHDLIRGKGVHDKVLEAIEICKKHGINILLTTVISKYNISSIEYVLGIAEKFQIGIYFQPVTQNMSNNCQKDIFYFFAPEENEYKKTISFLIKEKKKGNRFISHSLSGLKQLYHWPNPIKTHCFLNQICLFLESDGRMFICNAFPDYQRFLVFTNGNFLEIFRNLSLPDFCNGCWGSDLELNLIGSLKIDAILSMWKRFNH